MKIVERLENKKAPSGAFLFYMFGCFKNVVVFYHCPIMFGGTGESCPPLLTYF